LDLARRAAASALTCAGVLRALVALMGWLPLLMGPLLALLTLLLWSSSRLFSPVTLRARFIRSNLGVAKDLFLSGGF